jgi:hypothetical protein
LTPQQSNSLAALLRENQFPGSPHDQQLINQTLVLLDHGESIPLTNSRDVWSLANMAFQKGDALPKELLGVRDTLLNAAYEPDRVDYEDFDDGEVDGDDDQDLDTDATNWTWADELTAQLRQARSAPLILDLAAQVRDITRDTIDWTISENDVFAQVFEFPDHRRLQVWDEADDDEEIGGYSWQEQVWSGDVWVDVTDISTEDGIPPLSVDELLLDRLRTFHDIAQDTRPENLTSKEALLDQMARRALGATAAVTGELKQLQRRHRETVNDLTASQKDNAKMREALVALVDKFVKPPRPDSPATGPAAHTPASPTTGPAL